MPAAVSSTSHKMKGLVGKNHSVSFHQQRQRQKREAFLLAS